jgi:hypothetical protein
MGSLLGYSDCNAIEFWRVTKFKIQTIFQNWDSKVFDHFRHRLATHLDGAGSKTALL